MKQSDIKVGKTYRNRGVGNTTRTVIAIGDEYKPRWFGNGAPPKGPGVLYSQKGRKENEMLYLKSFAQWAGCEFKDGKL